MANHPAKFEVAVEKLVYGGEGLSRIDGRVVLTPFVLPQERALVETEREKPGLLRTRLVEILSASPRRVIAPCPYFARCGGCDYQHASYELQLSIKRSILEEELRRLGKMEPPAEIATVAAEPWHYRNRAQFHLSGGEIGYLEEGSRRLCPVDRCPISSPRINQILATLREMMREPRWPQFIRSLEVFTNENEVQLNVLETGRPLARRFFEWCAERIPGLVSGALDYPAQGGLYRVSARSFFQVNRHLIDALVDTALEGAEGETALDLYAGVGLFSIPLARRFRRVAAVESGGGAIRDLRFNAERAGVDLAAMQGNVEEVLQSMDRPPDFLLADPPRAGLGRRVVGRLASWKPPRVIIVACDPATLARDLAGLVAAGYRIERMSLVDLFPQTFHLETVVCLRAE